MQTQTFDARVREQGAAAIIDLHGEINAPAEQGLAKAYADARGRGHDAILLNFGGVHYINSTGIALIVGLLAQARNSGIPLLAFGLSEHYREIFRITRLGELMGVFPDEERALAEGTRSL